MRQKECDDLQVAGSMNWVNTRNNYHHHKHRGLAPLTRSVSRVTAAHTSASSVFQLFSFLVVCSGMISDGFGFVAFFASVKASSVCIQKTGMFGGPEVSYHQSYSARDWLSILRTHYPTRNLQRKHRTDSQMKNNKSTVKRHLIY